MLVVIPAVLSTLAVPIEDFVVVQHAIVAIGIVYLKE